jgi:hypothetical protein
VETSTPNQVSHTPGPWQAELPRRNDAHMCRITTAWEQNNCYLQLGQTWDPEHPVSYVGLSRMECIANARLMAAAPDLLAALKAIDALPSELAGEAWAIARAAIAKAEGR